nr:RNA-directed DNA polymerase, eukaryota, reverse transcriptase zinc-binding domain protein [Tanacetum cinerariifolium]
MVKDLRPISLIGCIYKIIAKILTNRLVGLIGDIVNEVQSAFIADRQILDGPFILNEVMHWCTVKKKQALIFKVDLEKAYDSVRWDFLDEVLQKFGFGNKWRMWIQSSLRSSRGSILVNGSPTEEFQFYKGINLSLPVNLSHMFYADDAVFIEHWNDSNINTLVNVLECFYRASGLRINMCKSKIMGVHVEADKAKGGLGVSSLYALNRGLMIKWLWRFYAQNTSLWVRVVKAIHGEDAKVGQNISSRSYSCCLNIVKEVSVLQAKGVNVMNYVRLKLGNGESTSFWEDNWINGGVLKDVFPRLYALEMCKKVYVSLKLKDSNLETSFHRKVRGGAEQAQLDILSNMVREVGLVPMSDRYIWSLEGSGDFSVASIRKV